MFEKHPPSQRYAGERAGERSEVLATFRARSMN